MPTSGNRINSAEILNDFNTKVIAAIKAGAYHSGNLPIEGGLQCIPPEMLDNIDTIQLPNIGRSGQKIDANVIYDNLVGLTANLTRMGTFSWLRRFKNTDRFGVVSYTTLGTLSGKAFFTTAYIRTLNPVGRSDLNSTARITATGLNNLLNNIINAWNNTSKYHYSHTCEQCHDHCHVVCHSACHGSCHRDCYSD